jgi:hypothetical protein
LMAKRMLYLNPAMKLRWKRASKRISTCSSHCRQTALVRRTPSPQPRQQLRLRCASDALSDSAAAKLAAPEARATVATHQVVFHVQHGCKSEKCTDFTGSDPLLSYSLAANTQLSESLSAAVSHCTVTVNPAASPPLGERCAPRPATLCRHQCRLHVTRTGRLRAAQRAGPQPDQAPAEGLQRLEVQC